MYVQSDWRCPYCGHANNVRVDVADYGPQLGVCDANQGGCGSLTVVNVARVEVLLRVRRVEGEGAAEDKPMPPVAAQDDAQPEEVNLSEPEPEPATVAVPALIVPNHGEPVGTVYHLPATGRGWKAAAEDWHLVAKGLVQV